MPQVTLGPEDNFFDRANSAEIWIVFGEGGNDWIKTGIAVDNLYGGTGDDTLLSISPDDTLAGGPGDDIYYPFFSFSFGGTIIDEALLGSGGRDTIVSNGSYSLEKPFNEIRGTIENLTVSDTSGEADAIGNELDNVITGNQHDGRIDGLGGNDLLTGGGGRDWFVFRAAINTTTNVDRITDFSHKDDLFYLDSKIFTRMKSDDNPIASKYFYKGKKAHDANDRIVYNDKNGELIYDLNGDKNGKSFIFAVLDGSPNNISSKDFLVGEVDFYVFY